MSTEQTQYGPGWLKCELCGFVGPDVVKLEAYPRVICAPVARCHKVIRRETLGGAPLDVGPLVRFELDAGELAAVVGAVMAWRERRR